MRGGRGPRKRIIFSLGFDTSGVISVLTELDLKPGDEIFFLVPRRDTPKSREARENIRRFLEMLADRGLELVYVFQELDEEDPASMIADIAGLIDEGEEVYVEALGGLRSIVASMTVAALLKRGKVAELAAVAESTGRRVKIPIPPLSPPRLDRLYREILHIALGSSNGIVTLPYLEEVLGKPKSTLSDRLHNLEKWGLLRKIKSRPATYTPTPLARVLAGRAEKRAAAPGASG